jgi:hypothetical protein
MHEIQTVEDINMHHGLDNPEDDTKANTDNNQPIVCWVYEVLDFLLHGGNSCSTAIGFFNQQRLKIFLAGPRDFDLHQLAACKPQQDAGHKKAPRPSFQREYAEPILLSPRSTAKTSKPIL